MNREMKLRHAFLLLFYEMPHHCNSSAPYLINEINKQKKPQMTLKNMSIQYIIGCSQYLYPLSSCQILQGMVRD